MSLAHLLTSLAHLLISLPHLLISLSRHAPQVIPLSTAADVVPLAVASAAVDPAKSADAAYHSPQVIPPPTSTAEHMCSNKDTCTVDPRYPKHFMAEAS